MRKLFLLTIPFLTRNTYIFLFSLLGLIYIIGLFVPLIDNDSAHHASIALHMYLTGDYASLVDQSGDYLDKPHLLFWLTAISYKIFGVTSFAYKLPSFLFTILGTYSVYRLGKTLYNNEAGKLAALIIASAFAYILANNDVRMDAILTASIAFACWQLSEFIHHKKLSKVAGAALALAIGFSTKGHIAVFVPGVFVFFYILYRKDWNTFLDWKWLLLVILFGVFISPVVYAYYLQYNLHPEKMVRGRDHINGVKFILLNQSIERFSGGMGGDAKNDYLFFLHSFLWAFAPWSILTYIAVAGRIKDFLQRKEEWGTTAAFVAVALVVSLSGFKLPHYLNIVFPLSAVMTAVYILKKEPGQKWILTIQLVVTVLLLLLTAFINVWAFPVQKPWIMVGTILLLAAVFYFIRSAAYSRLQKAVTTSAATMALAFFLLNSNFYPRLLQYQAGQALAETTKGKADPADVYIRPHSYSASYVFYSKSMFRPFNDSLLQTGKKVWLLTEPHYLEEVKNEGYQLGTMYTAPHFRVTKLNLKFMNPATRDKECSQMMIVEITGKK
ncbi:MAG: glycosyltransferase family 39 protein [Chitinophagaceae bacterium]|nr:glycosyltransferase family 39 protein [Chitinophagaceae bacterium]